MKSLQPPPTSSTTGARSTTTGWSGTASTMQLYVYWILKAFWRSRMPAKCFSKLTKLRDTVERETNGFLKDPSVDVPALMRRTSSGIAAFTKAHPALLAHARTNAQSAAPFVRPVKTREFPEWEPGGRPEVAGPGKDARDRRLSHPAKRLKTYIR